jgi:hypothetical protein
MSTVIGETHEKRRVNRKIGKSFTCSMFKKKKKKSHTPTTTIKRLGISKLREHNQLLPRLGDIPKESLSGQSNHVLHIIGIKF